MVEARDLVPIRKRRPRVTLREASGEVESERRAPCGRRRRRRVVEPADGGGLSTEGLGEKEPELE